MNAAASQKLPTYVWEPTTDFLAARYGLARESIVRFDVNTSPLAPDLRDVLAGTFDPPLCEYPPSDYASLVAAAAASYHVTPVELLPTAGADEALDLTARAYLREGSVAVVAAPTYAMYRIVSEQRGARVIAVPRLGPDSGFGLDIRALAEAARGAQLVWLCEPNNPTGAFEPPERIGELLVALESGALRDRREAPIVAVDEAYAEFVGRTVLPLRSDYPRLVVIRTLSKAHALAGIRVGFAVARPETLAPILSFRAPASVGTVSAALAMASLTRPELAADNVARIAAQRKRLADELSAIGWRPYPSQANFVLTRFSSPQSAASAGDALLRKGLVPRTFGLDHPLADCLRLTVRSAEENDRLIDAARGIPA
ncbi:MAG TPA: histidinol-phosphate transaminase [Candidatus Limnocylindrales bacterium]|jgi:Histidinol-phosphate/aromatic aminotransferase and cobyric acid decarboxylase|nr:histidinol-phosphate transaminase [Candidatus Limnocylindrales bacterium]